MATITGLTAERMLAIEAASVVSGEVLSDHLMLTKHDGTQIDAGNVRGPIGPTGPAGTVTPGSVGSLFMTVAGPSAVWSDPLKFAVDANGKLQWGNGTVLDVSLWRSGSGILRSDSIMQGNSFVVTPGVNGLVDLRGMTGGGSAARILLGVSGEANSLGRFYISTVGTHNWGDGTNPTDTTLYRAGAATLGIDGRVVLKVLAAGNEALNVVVAGESQERLKIRTNDILFGPGGSTGVDTQLYRSGAGQFDFSTYGGNVDGILRFRSMKLYGTGSGNPILLNYLLVADANPAFRVEGDGKHFWGPGGASGLDTDLYRWSAAVLATNGHIKLNHTAATLYFYADTQLYRSAAAMLKTDGGLIVGTTLVAGSPMNTSATGFGLALAHRGQIITLTGGGTVTLPSDATAAFANGDSVSFIWTAGAQPSFAAGSGATVNATPGLKIAAQYGMATAIKVAANTWIVTGNLSA